MADDADRFPDGFRWGTATAAHQIEGGNWNNDWWALGAHARTRACTEPSGDACDSWHRWRRGRRRSSPSSGSTTTASRSSGAASSPRRASSRTPRSTTTRRCARACRERGHRPGRHVPPLHHAAVGGRPGRLGASPTPSTGSPRSASGRPRRLGGLMARACTINEPNMVATIGYLVGAVPARAARDRDAAPRGQRDLRRRPPPGGRRDPRRRAGRAGRAHARHERLPGRRRRRGAASSGSGAAWRTCSSRRPTGDDFVGVQTYSRTRVGPDGVLGPEDGRARR